MNKVVEILCRRDGISEEEATRLVEETRDEILDSGMLYVDDIIAGNLGLEPDYIMDILEV